MILGPESERPTKAKATGYGKPTIYVPLNDEEWADFIKRQEDHEKAEQLRLANQYLVDREEAFAREIYPYIDEAKAAKELDDDPRKIEQLKEKRAEIRRRFPGG